jgi:hypothetical protein
MCEELRQVASKDATFLSRVITGDESWIYGYDLGTTQQSSQWKRKSKVKSMLITFIDIIIIIIIKNSSGRSNSQFCILL